MESHSQQALPAGWECAPDQATGHWYYFNRVTGATSWVHPHPAPHSAAPGSEAAATAASASGQGGSAGEAPGGSAGCPVAALPTPSGHPSQPPSQPAATAPRGAGDASRPTGTSITSSGWYYRDRAGALHGPFQQDHLRAWRSFLPMDLLVWYVELQPQQTHGSHGRLEQSGPGPAQEAAQGAGGGEVVAREGGEAVAAVSGNAEGSGGLAAAVARQEAAASSLGLGGYADAQPDGSDEDDLTGVRGGDGGEAEAHGGEAAAADGGAGGKGPAADDGPSRDGGGGATSKAGAAAVAAPEVEFNDDDRPSPKRARTEPAPAPSSPASGRGASPSVVPGAADGPTGRPAGPASAEEAIVCGLPGIELAELLGDGPLLADWRTRFPGHRPPGTSPPAPVHDHWLRTTAAAAAAAYAQGAPYGAQHGQYSHATAAPAAGHGGGGETAAADGGSRPRSREESMLEYAEAVLSGLPPDDEAVVLARQAAAAGRSLADVVNFSWGAASGRAAYGTAAAAAGGPVDEHGVPTEYVRDPRSGRLTAVGADAAPQNTAKTLYGEYGGWVDPDQIEDYLAKAKRWRQDQLPQLWARRKLKEQREAKAKRVARAAAAL